MVCTVVVDSHARLFCCALKLALAVLIWAMPASMSASVDVAVTVVNVMLANTVFPLNSVSLRMLSIEAPSSVNSRSMRFPGLQHRSLSF